MIHSSVAGVAPSSAWIDGSATFTIVVSSRIMPCPKHIATSVSRLRRASGSTTAARYRRLVSQTETCPVLSLVKGVRFQSAQRSRSVIPASRAIRSSSAGHT